jgi:hypothetical protein
MLNQENKKGKAIGDADVYWRNSTLLTADITANIFRLLLSESAGKKKKP